MITLVLYIGYLPNLATWNGKNPIYFGVIAIIPFDNLYRRAYFVMHTFLVQLYHGESKLLFNEMMMSALY
jgi:hypothetical protein